MSRASDPPALPAGDVLRAWRLWMLRSLPGRILIAGAAIKILTLMIGIVAPGLMRVLDIVDAAGSLALIFGVAYGLTRLSIWAKRRLLWRVRRKLILSYVFVGLVPGLLVIAFFMLAGMMLFFNVSSYLIQSRVRTVLDQARFLAQAVVLEAEHNEPAPLLTRRVELRHADAIRQFPFASITMVPVSGKQCGPEQPARTAVPPLVRVGEWRHLAPPASVPRWIACDGWSGLIAYRIDGPQGEEARLVVRAVAMPQSAAPQWAAIVDLPFTHAVEQRLRGETGIRLGDLTALPFVLSVDPRRQVTIEIPKGNAIEQRPALGDGATTIGQEWVTLLDHHHWETGAASTATVATELNIGEIYQRMAIPSSQQFNRLLLGVLAFIGVLFLIIQGIALMIGFALARQITGAVHDLFSGTERLRNRDFTHQIPVRAQDQLGELADSFNVMTGEVTKLLIENADKARMEQEMLAAREIQQKLLPSGPLNVPGLSITAFCEPAREVAGDYYDFLVLSENRVGVLIADVSGKGLPAGLYMAQLKVLVQSLARVHSSPRDFLIAINRVVADNIDSKSFITMSYAVIDLERQEMTFARAGHCPLVHVPGNAPPGMRKSQMLAPDGLVLGLKIDDGQMFDGMLCEMTVPLAPGDLVVLFTDGISETMNPAFDCYGEPRLAHVLEQYSHLPFEQLREFIFADLRAFSDGADQHDDMTMILMKVEERTAA